MAGEGVLRAAVRAGAGFAVLMLTACGGVGAGASGDVADGVSQVSEAVVRITPEDRAEDVAPAGALRVTAAHGRLTQVTVEDAEGERVAGRITGDGSGWEPDRKLALATKYTVEAVAVDGHGREAAKHSAFTTLVPRDTFIGFFTPEDGSLVGVGMEFSVVFNRPITDRQAVQRAIRVTSEPDVEVAPHWFGDRRLDFRPEEYWPPGTRVTASLRLKDVQGAPGVYGIQSKEVGFTVGRSQISTVDSAAHTMTVRRDGQVLKVLPITAGSPENTTYNGRMVVTERFRLTRMNGDTVGFGGEYDIPDVPHAMRLTTSGTFIHGNYWAPKDTFGKANTSHGCVGLPDVKGGGAETPAGWFFDNTILGDVVEVRNSHDQTVAPDNGLNGWNMDWGAWRQGGDVFPSSPPDLS